MPIASIDRLGNEADAYDERFAGSYKPYARVLNVLVFMIGDALAVIVSMLLGEAGTAFAQGTPLVFVTLAVKLPYLAIFIAGFSFLRLYPGLSLAPSEELRRFTLASFFGFSVMILVCIVKTEVWNEREWSCLFSLVLSIPILTAGRVFTRSRCTRTRWWGVPAVIFGAGVTGKEFVDRLLACPWIGYKPIVMLDDDPVISGQYNGVPILHGTANGPIFAERYSIATAIIAMPGVQRKQVADIIDRCTIPFKHIILIPDIIGMTSIWLSVHDFEGYLGLSMSQKLFSRSNQIIKRFIELLITFTASLFVSPLFLLISLAVKIDSPGPILYGHMRLGRNGKEYKAWKFRTMRIGADDLFASFLEANPDAKTEWEESFKIKNDPRITRIGKLLRVSSLDELPQLWNVIRGEMSLIGPRPIIREELKKYGPSWNLVSSVTPGVSGLWQVSGRSDTSYPERVELDLYYIRNWSLWMDLYIAFKTVWIIVTGKGAY